ncbi:disulfide isomerase DsbC N-terminal domain-containing protein [Pseudoalteromonas fenneropenaei]|uniref:Disulfide isomerase DsbC N-terminal domain-containing protein n=1 Tax=Pseudoalteromonas fenneropenaei TaxID=1737459 RepID=A0ABV7CNA2_9GAMM
MKLNFLYTYMFIASSLSFASDVALTETIAKAAEERESTYREEVKVNLEKKGDIVGIRELPMKKLFFVEAENGSYVVSADGRFVFDGRLVDVWHRKTIKTLSDATAIQRTPVANIGLKPEEQLATFKVGNETLPRSGVAFVDPTSQYTTRFLKHIEDSEKYNFTIVLAPLVGGNNAVDRARRLWCATDKAAAKQDLINGTSLSFNDIEKVCSEEPIQMAGVLSGVFNIQELPHIIREDGLVSEGLPLDFDKWYEQP